MPIFEYVCEKCNNIFELIVPYNTDDHEICPKCKGQSIKILSISNFIVNGYSESNGYSKGKQ